MLHSIFMRDLREFRGRTRRLVAYDIPEAVNARRLVRRLATSYAEHGLNAVTLAYWFRDAEGVHEVWTEPQIDALRYLDQAAAAGDAPAKGIAARRPARP